MESNNNWKVISTGKMKANFTEKMVIENIKQILKLDNVKATELIQGIPSVVKKGIDKQEAIDFQSLFEISGLETILEEDPDRSIETPKFDLNSLSLMPSVDDANQATTITCPICEKQQPASNKCIYCAADMETYLQEAKSVKPKLSLQPEYQPTQRKSARPSHNYRNFEEPTTIVGTLMANKKYLFLLVVLAVIIKIFIIDRANYQDIGSSPGALAQIAMLEKIKSYPKQDAKQLRGWLESKQYYQLESVLSDLNNDILLDISWEGIFIDAINKISNSYDVNIGDLNNWVNETGSAYAYLARGAFYVNAGGEARGSKILGQTNDTQLTEMSNLYRAAYADLMQAKSLDNSLLPVYALLIRINIDDGTPNPRETILNEAIAINPAGYQYRDVYMFYLRPKWGGSWAEMEELALASSAYISFNPRINLLSGYILAEKGDIALKNKEFKKCISFYSDALQYGIKGEWLRKRAYCLYDNGDFDRALKDINMFYEYGGNPSDYDKRLKRYLTNKLN